MLRSVLGAAAVATAMSLTLPVAPAAADKEDPLEGLTVHPEWGSITGHSGVLRKGCRTYTFSYSITPPEGVWAIEVFINGPGLKRLGGGAFLQGYDGESGTGSYKLCRYTTRYGRFTIQAKLSVDDGYGNITEGKLPADHYRLHRKHEGD